MAAFGLATVIFSAVGAFGVTAPPSFGIQPHYVRDSVSSTSVKTYAFSQAPGPFALTVCRLPTTPSTAFTVSLLDDQLHAVSGPHWQVSFGSTTTVGVISGVLPSNGGGATQPRTWYITVQLAAKTEVGKCAYGLSLPEEDDNIPGADGPSSGEVAYGSVDSTRLVGSSLVGDSDDVYHVYLYGGHKYAFTLAPKTSSAALHWFAPALSTPFSIWTNKNRYELGLYGPTAASVYWLGVPLSAQQGDLSEAIQVRYSATRSGTYYLDARALVGTADYQLSWTEIDDFDTNTDIAIDGPDTAAYAGAEATIDGVLTCDVEGQDLTGMPIQIEYEGLQVKGDDWKPLPNGGTTIGYGSDGAFELAIGPIGQSRQYRAAFYGYGSLDSAFSEPIEIRAKLKLKAPKITGKLKANGVLTLTGKIPDVTKRITFRIEVSRVVNGKLKKFGDWLVATDTKGAFMARLTLHYRGVYKLRLYAPASADFDASASKYVALRLK